jgi:hypothetical protein
VGWLRPRQSKFARSRPAIIAARRAAEANQRVARRGPRTLPAFTPRGFWVRIVVFGGSLLVYLWGVLIMSRERSRAGVVLLSLLAALSLTRFIVTVMRRPFRRPR